MGSSIIASKSQIARALTIEILNSKEISAVEFMGFTIFIRPSAYRRVARDVACGRVKVKYQANARTDFNAHAFYIAAEDTFYFGSTEYTPQTKKTIVHEATHCIHDAFGRTTITIAESEADARIAGALYAQAIGLPKPRPRRTLLGRVDEKAWAIADAIRSGRPYVLDPSTGQRSPISILKQELLRIVKAIPSYAGDRPVYNGIGR